MFWHTCMYISPSPWITHWHTASFMLAISKMKHGIQSLAGWCHPMAFLLWGFTLTFFSHNWCQMEVTFLPVWLMKCYLNNLPSHSFHLPPRLFSLFTLHYIPTAIYFKSFTQPLHYAIAINCMRTSTSIQLILFLMIPVYNRQVIYA